MDQYVLPLVERYASPQMIRLFSPETKFRTWRKLWIALAEAQKELGLVQITEAQLEELRRYRDQIPFEAAQKYEKEFRHDVMAHIHAYGDQCPSAKSILHLGATSAYVGDNTDLILLREGMFLLRQRLLSVVKSLSDFALQYHQLPTLAFTHFQPAQLTTVGKRACLWLQDLKMDFEELTHFSEHLKFLGVKGTTGTQASFLELFSGQEEKVLALDQNVAHKMGFSQSFLVSGQTYPRKVDTLALQVLAEIAQSAYKFAEDLRLLSHLQEIEEPFESKQIGSSAMAYKQNPIRSERICSLSRFVINLVPNAYFTASTQWFERTLDDSANRRLTLPQAFLAVDAILILYYNILKGIRVHEKKIAFSVRQELPFMITEPILMEACKQGGDRQKLHEQIRKLSVEVREQMQNGGPNDLLARLEQEPGFQKIVFESFSAPERVYGRAPQQVLEFIQQEIKPILQHFSESEEISLRV